MTEVSRGFLEELARRASAEEDLPPDSSYRTFNEWISLFRKNGITIGGNRMRDVLRKYAVDVYNGRSRKQNGSIGRDVWYKLPDKLSPENG